MVCPSIRNTSYLSILEFETRGKRPVIEKGDEIDPFVPFLSIFMKELKLFGNCFEFEYLVDTMCRCNYLRLKKITKWKYRIGIFRQERCFYLFIFGNDNNNNRSRWDFISLIKNDVLSMCCVLLDFISELQTTTDHHNHY